MRSYNQFCSLAKALDLIGDRWTLLIVRELLIRGDSRYTDLKNGLPGIASNLLAERLKQMEMDGILVREEAPPPVATTVFRLTERGKALRPVLAELGRWGSPLLAQAPQGEALCSHWLAMPASLYLRDRQPKDGPLTIRIQVDEETITLRTAADGTVDARIGRFSETPDLILKASSPRPILGLLMHRISPELAAQAGVTVEGNPKILRRLEQTLY